MRQTNYEQLSSIILTCLSEPLGKLAGKVFPHRALGHFNDSHAIDSQAIEMGLRLADPHKKAVSCSPRSARAPPRPPLSKKKPGRHGDRILNWGQVVVVIQQREIEAITQCRTH